MEEMKVGLVKGRHELPVDDYIFDEIGDVTDFKAMDKVTKDFMVSKVGLGQYFRRSDTATYEDEVTSYGEKSLVVYVTGLSAALAAVIKSCARNCVPLTLMHYDRETGSYVPQQIF